MIWKHVFLITFLNEPEFIFFAHTILSISIKYE